MATTLNFTKEGDVYIAEQTVNAPYALHIERSEPSSFSIKQRSTDSGQYASCWNVPDRVSMSATVIDWSFDHTIYPMHVRFESGSEVTSAEITEAQS